MKHLRVPVVLACLAAAGCLVPQAAQAQANPRIGTWRLNVAKSTYQQGTKPSSETRTYLEREDGALQLTSDARSPTGTKVPSGYRAKFDGKDYPYSGPTGDTIAITGDGWTSDSTIKMRGKIAQTTHTSVSKDGKTMTQISKTASGRRVSTRVYEKQ